METGIYIHIPFCVQKCAYCDFLSFPCGDNTKKNYVQALMREIQAYKNKTSWEVPTIFLGGGTPSVLKKDQLEAILETVYDTFSVKADAEVTMEMNPGTVDVQNFSLPSKVNRVSLGLQSVHDRELRKLGRIHTYQDFLNTYHELRNRGIKNINVDLMSALPGQSMADWVDTLTTIAQLEPEHISAYSLIVEEGTPFASMELDLPTEEEERMIYMKTRNILEKHGYYRYEISNYAKPGYDCRHNISYWKRVDYLGVGLGASSLIDNHRFHNTTSMEEYLTYSNQPKLLYRDKELLSKQAQMEEFMFLGLRMTEGVSKAEFQHCFGEDMDEIYAAPLEKLTKQGLIENEKQQVYLTSKGVDLSNYAMAEFLL